MKEQVLHYIRTNHMLNAGDHIITGVSGGADSVCLLFMLVLIREELDLQLTVVHVNHGLRGRAAAEDAAFTKSLCEKWQVAYKEYSYQVGEIAAERKISVEEAGRQVRYECFEAARTECNADKIAVAHNEDDQAETILMNLVRGSGLKGLGGILPVRDHIIRPLLGTKRSQIETFLEQHQIPYRTDQTNLEEDYTRNKLRLHVLPYLKKEINNQVVSHICASGEIIREADAYIWKEADRARSTYVSETAGGRLLGRELRVQEPEVIQKYVILRELQELAGTQRDISAIHVQAVCELADNQTGRSLMLPYGLTAERTYEGTLLRKKQGSSTAVNKGITRIVPVQGKIYVPESDIMLQTWVENRDESKIILENKYTKCFDYDIIKGDLQLRTRLPGDYFMMRPDGGRKKLKSYFIDQKIPREERDQIMVLAEGSHVLWIPGYRISAYYKITEKTKNIWKVHYDGGKCDG